MNITLDLDVFGQLMPNVLTIITQLCATAFLSFIIYRLAWKPVKEILAKRSEYEQSKIKEAETLAKENAEINAKVKEELSAASRKAQETISKAQAEGNRVKNNLVEEGKAKSQQIIEDAQASIEIQKQKMIENMHEQIVDVAMSAAEKMLQSKLDEESDKAAIENFVKEVSNK